MKTKSILYIVIVIVVAAIPVYFLYYVPNLKKKLATKIIEDNPDTDLTYEKLVNNFSIKCLKAIANNDEQGMIDCGIAP